MQKSMNSATSYVLTNFSLLTGNPDQQEIQAIAIHGNRFEKIGQLSDMPEGYETIDLQGLTVTPGFIDVQLNGCGGVNLNTDISEKTLDIIHETNLRFGCTTYLPTLITATDEDIKKAIDVVFSYQKKYPERLTGLHIEGPYLNPARKGIHDPDLIRKPSAEMLDYLCSHAETITKITLAPEMVGTETIRQLSEAGIVVSIGHTNATCAETKAAEKAGARFITHLHNAMSPLASREPGVVGAAFDSDVLCAGIIADGYHLSWENLRIARTIMQDRLVLVTDATAAAGSDLEQFEFGGHTVYHKNGKCTGADGTLGGSALTMIEAVTNTIEHGIPAEIAVRMATLNPARALGREQEYGVIAEDAFANLTILDRDFKVRGTISGGSIILD